MRPRVKNAAVTREMMLASARSRFLHDSYENVGLRDIAGDAGVDVALVGRYFGSKEQLFREVLEIGTGQWLEPDLDAATLPAWLAVLVTQEQRSGEAEDIERLLIILRSASSPSAAPVVQQCFRENVLHPLAKLLEGPDAEMRASVALSLVMGATVLRTIMVVGPLQLRDADAVRSKLTGLFAAALA